MHRQALAGVSAVTGDQERQCDFKDGKRTSLVPGRAALGEDDAGAGAAVKGQSKTASEYVGDEELYECLSGLQLLGEEDRRDGKEDGSESDGNNEDASGSEEEDMQVESKEKKLMKRIVQFKKWRYLYEKVGKDRKDGTAAMVSANAGPEDEHDESY